MKFSYNWLKELVDIKESPKKMAEILTLRAFEVETVEKIGKDYALDIKLYPNRMADAAGHIGMAREISALLNRKLKLPKPKKIRAQKGAEVKIKIASSELCPRYTAQPLAIDTIGASPHWMQERLIVCGFRPIDAVVDTTNYVMLETGHPLHAFDLEKIRGLTMSIRESKTGETLVTLDGVKHSLPEKTIIIENAERIIDLAGIMGGQNSAVGKETKKILLQAAVFDAPHIYRATKSLGLSEAGKIYAAGVEPEGSKQALERATEILMNIAGAEPAGETIDAYRMKTRPTEILFRPDYANNLIGENLSQFYAEAFKRIGCRIKKQGKNYHIQTPPRRHDLSIEQDLIEEAGRLYGYENIHRRFPEIPLLPARRNEERYWEKRIRSHAETSGFTETLVYEFASEKENETFFIDQASLVEIENPVSPETQYLVPRLLMKYVTAAAQNLKHAAFARMWGIGKSFTKNPTGVHEEKNLVFAAAKQGEDGEEGFYRMKGAIDALLDALGIDDHWYNDHFDYKLQATSYKLYHPYRVAEIKIGDETIGMIGEIHPDIHNRLKAKARIAACEINFETLWRAATNEVDYRPIGRFPAMIRDIAVVVPFYTKTEEVLNIIEPVGGNLLIDTDLFDYFQDEEMRESEEKSLAFHLIFQSPDKTLTEPEVDVIMKSIARALEEKNFDVRK